MEILSSIINSSSANDFLKIVGNHVNIDKNIISHLKQHLLKPDLRNRGLAYLDVFISQCTSDVLNEHGVFWVEICLKGCKSTHVGTQINIFNILSKILQSCNESPDLHKRISTDYLVKIIDSVYDIQPGLCQSLSALNCLRVCLKVFPGFCGYHRSNIEKYLFSYIDSVDPNKIYLISQCFHYLPQTSGSGTQGSVHKAQWIAQQMRLCVTLHSVLNNLFEYVEEMNQIEINDDDQFDFPEIVDDENKVIQIFKLANRFNNCTKLLQTMLIEPFPTSKGISLDKIMNIISRTFNINDDSIKKDSLDDVALGTIITSVHNSSLQLLDTLILSVGTNILPYAGVICKILIDVLENTNLEFSKEKASVLLKIQAYKSLTKWLSLTGGASCINLFSDSLIPILINDLTCNRLNCIVITQNNTPLTLKPKKKHQLKESNYLKNRIESINDNSNHNFSQSDNLRTKLSYVVLKTIQHLLESQSVLLQPLIHKVLQEILVKQILELKKKSELSLYKSKLCCKQLYQTLITLVINFHPTMPPPTFCVLDVLSSGQKDKDFEISQICTNGLLILEKIIHPPVPSLCFLNQKENPNYIVNFEENTKKRKYTEDNCLEDSSDMLVATNDLSNDSNHSSVNNVVETNLNISDLSTVAVPENMNMEVVEDNKLNQVIIIENKLISEGTSINKESTCELVETQPINCNIDKENLPSEVNPETEMWEVETEILVPTFQENSDIDKDIANLHDLHENFSSQELIDCENPLKKCKLSHMSHQVDIQSSAQTKIEEYNGIDKINENNIEETEQANEIVKDKDELDIMLASFVDVVQ